MTSAKASAGTAVPQGTGRSCTGCGQPLSRYNPEDVCGSCASAARDTAPGTPAVDSARLKQLREQRGITQRVLADRAGVSASLVEKLETGARKSASLATLTAIAGILATPVDGILEGHAAEADAGSGTAAGQDTAAPAPRPKINLRREKRDLREGMRAQGLSYRQVAAEFARAYGLRPRTAWREAYGWSLQEAAERINAYKGETGLDPGGISGMTAPHLSEHETWPGHGHAPTGRKPSPYLLAVLASVYDSDVSDLVDLADRKHMPKADLLVIDTYNPPAPAPESDTGDRGGRNTLLATLLAERHWRTWETFEAQFNRAARELAEHEEEPGLADVTVSSRTYERWLSGQTATMPRPKASRVLEHMLGYPVHELLRPPQDDAEPDDDEEDTGSLSAAVRPLMAAQGIGLRALARTVKYDPSSLSKIIAGRKTCPPLLAELIDEALDASGAVEHAAATDRDHRAAAKATRQADEAQYVIVQLPGTNGEVVPVAITRRALTSGAIATAQQARHVQTAAQIDIAPPPVQKPPASDEARDPWETDYDSDEELMRRRAFLVNLAALTGLGAADTPAAIEAIRRELNLSLIEERAGTHVNEWQQITQDYGEVYPSAEPAKLIEPLMADMLGMQVALRRNEGNAAQPDLLRVTALLSAFTAQTISNMGQPLEARRWWRTAKTAADRSGDPYSVLWVRGREIVRAMESRPVPAILGLIEGAEGVTRNAPPEATLELIAAKAQTLALAGRKREATAALAELRDRFDESPGGFSGNILSWGQERLHSTESFSYSRLGDLPRAEVATTDGIRLRAANGDTSIRPQAQLQLNLAFALVNSGDISEGLSHARTVISSVPESHLHTQIHDGRKLLGTVPIAAQRRPDVQEYREWVNSLTGPAAE